MFFSNPTLYLGTQCFRQRSHLFGFFVRDGAADLVARNISLLAERIKVAAELGIGSDRQFQGVNHPIVVGFPGCSIPGGGQRRCSL